ncbi:hypothetical protein FB45DRAFT_70654 [Roridomyces roridus]|uniref:Uncharacterized protein n=1 Tax=Roridomyces roridus TaxID=1738132 RepID=A0AAD7FIC5_9AGAR|nr:hypothetical protein FB45DRAFT_70654 [Roridomyces roridus]
MPEDFLPSPRKGPVNRRSTASLRGPTSLAAALDAGDDAANGRYSLAHELAVAMMPEPSAGSKLLAEEFGIEFDEGAEGIDEPASGPHINLHDADPELSFADSDPPRDDSSLDDGPPEPPDVGVDPTFGSPLAHSKKSREARPEQDAMEVLAQDLESTDKFLSHLRRLDVDGSSTHPSSSSSSSSQPALERLASDVIRRINDTARDREGQLRELLEYEREFRRIAGEVGGQDVLGRLDALPVHEPDEEPADAHPLASIPEDTHSSSPTATIRPSHLRAMSQDWETDPDVDRLGDTDPAYDGRDDEGSEPPTSPSATQTGFSFSTSSSGAPPSAAPRGPAGQLADLRGLTTSLVASLTSVSEHAQVNGAATAEAGRKIRALRNRLGGWRTEWEGAERSRGRIERWEAGEAWETSGGSTSGDSTPVGTPSRGVKRVDGRKVVQEHLHAFELALDDAAVKTKAIMAAS